MQQAPAKKSQKRPVADAAEEAAAAAAAEARLMEREEEEENEMSFHVLCFKFHGKFLPPILRSVVTLAVRAAARGRSNPGDQSDTEIVIHPSSLC